MTADNLDALAQAAYDVPLGTSTWAEFLRSLPVCLAIYGYSAVQEALGYLLGAGGARDEFNAVELAHVREE